MWNETHTYFQEGNIVFIPSAAKHKFLIKNFFLLVDEKSNLFELYCDEDATSKGRYNRYMLVQQSIALWRSLHPSSKFWKMREDGAISRLRSLHDVTVAMMKLYEEEKLARGKHQLHVLSRTNTVSSKENLWQATFDRFSIEGGTVEDLKWFNDKINSQFKSSMLWVTDYRSLKELLVNYCHVTDIDPAECVRDAPFNSMRHTLSYLIHPCNDSKCMQDSPSWTNLESPGQGSVHFSKKIVDQHCESNPRLAKLMDLARNVLPLEFREHQDKPTKVSKEETIKIIRDNVKFDEFTSNKNGTNPSGGTVRKSASLHPTPFRKNYSDGFSVAARDGEEELYSYSLAFVKPFEWRAELVPEELAEFKVCVWKAVWKHLSPLSKLMPPNGIQTLLYLNSMGGHINPHRDMSPNMKVDPDQNSQIIGSSVIVVSFYASQYFKFGAAMPGENKFDYPPMLQFLTENGSM